jgi:glyoxylase-like metal-dependent hydrolase (beta-lactamase superfamily II)
MVPTLLAAGGQKFPRSLAKGLWVIGNYFFNLYLVRGERASALIECGVSGMIDSAIHQLESLSVTPDYLVMTHPHADHASGLEGLRDRYSSARLVAARGAREFLNHPKAIGNMIFEDSFMSGRLMSLGLAPKRPPIDQFALPGEFICVRDELDIDLGGVLLRCKRVEGHSPGNLLVHIDPIKAAAVSDSMGFRYPGRSIFPLFLTGYRRYMQTLDLIKALRPQILCLGHQGPVAGQHAENALESAMAAAEKLLQRIEHWQDSPEKLAQELFRESYRDEFTLYSEQNIKSVAGLLIRRGREYLDDMQSQT